MPEKDSIKGIDKAAIVLLLLGEELAADVLKHLSPTELQLIAKKMAGIEGVDGTVADRVKGEFLKAMHSVGLLVKGDEFLKKTITRALGNEKAKDIIELLSQDEPGESLTVLKLMDPQMTASLLKDEHPQIIALVLTHMEPDKAAKVMEHFPERLRADVIMRIATTESVPPGVLNELEEVIKQQIKDSGMTKGRMVEGVKIAADILNQLESSVEKAVLETIEKTSADIAEKIQDKMFVFTDLLSVDNRGMQMLIKECDTETLAIALKGADEELRERFFSNMSQRAAEMLKEDIESRGPVKLSDVEKAQLKIINIAKRLEQEGKLIREGKGSGDVLV